MTDRAVPLIVRRLIPAPRARIFDAFASAASLSQWFTPSAEIGIEVVTFDFAPGGRFRLRYTMPDGRRPVVGGVYEQIDQPERIVLSWIWEPPDPLAGIPMRVRFAFEEADDGTEVIITHEGLPSDQACTIHENGWVDALDSLGAYLGAIDSQPKEPTAG